jgi:hypothetical protein
MQDFVAAFAELDTDDLDVMADEFHQRTERCLTAGQDGWARVYALITCAAIDALNGK